jgi:putative protease
MSIIPPANSVLLGRVEDYYAHIGVITLTLKSGIRLGDHLHVLGHTTNLEFSLDSMQINHQSVSEGRAKDGVGIKISSRARRGDYVFLIRG